MTTETKTCQNCKADFVIEPEDFEFYEKMQVPAPTFCPKCRFQRRLMFKNERYLYNRQCARCGKVMLAGIPSESPLVVYCNPCWWTGDWGGEMYARDYDPNRNFFEQFRELMLVVPFNSTVVDYLTMINSDYTNYAGHLKDCYLTYDADTSENILYSKTSIYARDSMDCFGIHNAERCYETTMSADISDTHYSDNCRGCINVYFSCRLSGCSDCFGCINLRNKKYCWFNEQLTKEEFQRRLAARRLHTVDGILKARQEADAFFITQPVQYITGSHNDCVSGEYVGHSKNARDMYLAQGCENTRYCQFLSMKPTTDSYDYTEWGATASHIYECITVGDGADNVRFSWGCWRQGTMNQEYCMHISSSQNMFGCIGMKKKRFCILNREYPQDEFERLRARIVDDMMKNPYVDHSGRVWRYGEFFPYDFAVPVYNESVAQQYFPLSKDEAATRGFMWREGEVSQHTITKKARELPSDIDDTNETILSDILECQDCRKAYRIVPAELLLLRRFRFPLPRKCPNCRHHDRLLRVNAPVFHKRRCACVGAASQNGLYQNTAAHIHHGIEPCPNTFQTSYAPDRPEIVYCEKCYQAEVV